MGLSTWAGFVMNSDRELKTIKHYTKQNKTFFLHLYTSKSQKILSETYQEVKMKLNNKTNIVLGTGMSVLLLGIIILLLATTVKAVSNEDPSSTPRQSTEGFLTPTAIRIPAPTNCRSGQVPTYTDPKGGSVSCGGSEGNTAYNSIPFLVMAFVGGIVLEALRATN